MNELYTFTFTREQLSTITSALYELPFKDASPIIQDMQRQIDAAVLERRQQVEAAEAASEEDGKE